MKTIAVVATDMNGVIAKNGSIPWRCPEDLKNFQKLTENSLLLCGRTTFETLPNKMIDSFSSTGRMLIVFTKNPKALYEKYPELKENLNISVTDSGVGSLLSSLKNFAFMWERLVVIGGSSVYEQAIPQVDYIYQSIIHTATPFDVCEDDIDTFSTVGIDGVNDCWKSEVESVFSGDGASLGFTLYKHTRV